MPPKHATRKSAHHGVFRGCGATLKCVEEGYNSTAAGCNNAAKKVEEGCISFETLQILCKIEANR
jgi:hypothetical protein